MLPLIRTKDVNPNKLIELQGIAGPFYALADGMHREAGRRFFYADNHVEFYFYAEWIGNEGNNRIVVTNAAYGRDRYWILRKEGMFELQETIEIVKQNIEFLFHERSILDLNQISAALSRSITVEFDWRLG